MTFSGSDPSAILTQILDHADDSVEAFGHGIGQARVDEGQDAVGVFAHGAHELAQGLQEEGS